ncbi:hypothetical protein AALO_G00179040 [Alosa alosa]|uniref:Uncharacterized protein n=1 Tax=Alosa alosa TaxID=278164 RepID=A0AAV6G8E0_9TELE|nr:hypothetical protein AALO_G00179040 [Alosa alosa]
MPVFVGQGRRAPYKQAQTCMSSSYVTETNLPVPSLSICFSFTKTAERCQTLLQNQEYSEMDCTKWLVAGLVCHLLLLTEVPAFELKCSDRYNNGVTTYQLSPAPDRHCGFHWSPVGVQFLVLFNQSVIDMTRDKISLKACMALKYRADSNCSVGEIQFKPMPTLAPNGACNDSHSSEETEGRPSQTSRVLCITLVVVTVGIVGIVLLVWKSSKSGGGIVHYMCSRNSPNYQPGERNDRL